MSSPALLKQELRVLNSQINVQIEAIKREAEARPEVRSVFDLKYPDGKFVMPELLASKAQVLNALAALELAKK